MRRGNRCYGPAAQQVMDSAGGGLGTTDGDDRGEGFMLLLGQQGLLLIGEVRGGC